MNNITIQAQQYYDVAVCEVSQECFRYSMRLIRDQFYLRNEFYLYAVIVFVVSTLIMEKVNIKGDGKEQIEFIINFIWMACACFIVFWSLNLILM